MSKTEKAFVGLVVAAVLGTAISVAVSDYYRFKSCQTALAAGNVEVAQQVCK